MAVLYLIGLNARLPSVGRTWVSYITALDAKLGEILEKVKERTGGNGFPGSHLTKM